MSHQFVGLLGRRVEADRVVDVVPLRERHARVAAVHARTRGVYEVLDSLVAAAFEDREEAAEVAVDVGPGIDERVANSSLSGEVDDAIEAFAGEERCHCRAVGEVESLEAKVPLPGELLQAILLEADVVVVVEVVDADDAVATAQQAERGVHADEAGSAGNQNFQIGNLPSARPHSAGSFFSHSSLS